ncbi:hypothetical protein AURDEDRAFT_175166 [Auricularia subglabra TFB-10046 SS5]|nr:hypothetical protein AURDEDRAFT_175166 [Auricularia subglabra TFB-10046 SS5]
MKLPSYPAGMKLLVCRAQAVVELVSTRPEPLSAGAWELAHLWDPSARCAQELNAVDLGADLGFPVWTVYLRFYVIRSRQQPRASPKLVFKNANLAHGEHRLTVADWNTWIRERRAPLYSLFDYALYTTDVDDLSDTQVSIATTATPPDSTISIPKSGLKLRHRLAIICTSVPVAFTIITGTLWYLCLCRKNRTANRSTAPTPIVYGNTPDDHLQPYPISLSRPVKAILRLLDEKPRRPDAKLPAVDKMPPSALVRGTIVALDATPEQPISSNDVADLRTALERMREENEMLRLTSGPPPEYSDDACCEGA